jgi:hypothetical protein
MFRLNAFASPLVAGLALVLATASTAGADTFTFANGTNTSLGTSQLINLNPDLIVHQQAPNYTLATAQAVSPQYYAYDVLGSINNNSTPNEFFSYALNSGDQLTTFVQAGHPATQFPETLLYDPNGNLVAIANGNAPNGSSSIITFTVPNGDAGNWTSQVTASPNAPPTNFNFDLRISGPFLKYQTDVLGTYDATDHSGFYSVAANAGDHLHFLSTAGMSGASELLLFDPNGNLVAIANGNGPNGISSIIDFTVPVGDAGNWIVEVTGNPNVTGPNFFDYDLQISGATGLGPIDPLAGASVPEPSSLVLCGVGMLGLLTFSRRAARSQPRKSGRQGTFFGVAAE